LSADKKITNDGNFLPSEKSLEDRFLNKIKEHTKTFESFDKWIDANLTSNMTSLYKKHKIYLDTFIKELGNIDSYLGLQLHIDFAKEIKSGSIDKKIISHFKKIRKLIKNVATKIEKNASKNHRLFKIKQKMIDIIKIYHDIKNRYIAFNESIKNIDDKANNNKK